MEIANVLLAVAGDRGNTVPKTDVTAAEAAVLRFVHGEDAVFDIALSGEVARTHRQEIARLTDLYGRQEGERRVSPAVEALYPGAAARVFEKFEELEIPEEFFAVDRKAIRAAAAVEIAAPVVEAGAEPAEVVLSDMTVNQLKAHGEAIGVDLNGVTKKADIIEAIELHKATAAPVVDDEDENDGTGPMTDGMFE